MNGEVFPSLLCFGTLYKELVLPLPSIIDLINQLISHGHTSSQVQSLISISLAVE
jgi:hypothetical protein